MLKDLEKELKKAEELDYQSAENYPWEYSQNSEEIFVADLKALTNKPQFQKAEEALDLDGQIAATLAEQNVDPVLESEELVVEETITAEQNIDIDNEEQNEESEENIEDDFVLDEQSSKDLADSLDKLEQSDFSWLFASLVLFLILAGGEWLLYFIKNYFFWSDQSILLYVWLWRFVLLITWLYFAIVKKNYLREKIVASALLSFTAGVLLLGIWKILAIKSVWTCINILIELICALLLVALVASLFMKIYKSK